MKNKVKTKLLSLFLIGVMALGISGCGASAEKPAEANPDAEETTEITTNADVQMETIRVWSDNAHEKEVRLQQIDKFNETIGKEKGINIEYTVHGSNWEDVIRMAAQSDEAPDLFRPNGTFIKDFIDGEYLIPISELPGSEEFLQRYDGSLQVNQHIFHDKVYTLPYNLTTYKFVINRDLFDKNGLAEPPKTWEEVREFAKIITDNGDGVEFGYSLGLQSNWISTAYLLRPAGRNMGHIGFDNDTLQFEYSKVLPQIDAMRGMVADGSVLPGASGLDADAMRAQFAEGRVGMLLAVSFDVGVYNEQFPAKCNWEVVDIPTFESGPAPYKEFTDATSLLGVGKAALDTPEKAAKVLEVMEFFYSDECMAEMYENSLYIPFRQEAQDLATREPEQRGFKEFANVPDKVLLLPIPDRLVAVEGQNYSDAILGLLTEDSDADPVAVLADLDERYNEALESQVDKELLETFGTPEGRDIIAAK
jgi:ABC-type sugar transport system, periplasmic component